MTYRFRKSETKLCDAVNEFFESASETYEYVDVKIVYEIIMGIERFSAFIIYRVKGEE